MGPSTADSEPATLLYRALLYRNLTVVQNILERNPDLANAEMRGTRPLAIACESRNLELVRLVIEKGADVNAKAAEGWSILFHAVQHDSVEIAKYLILKGANPGDLPVEPAITATLRENLGVVDQAIADSQQALAADPASESARDSLFDALRQKVGLLQATVTLINEIRRAGAEPSSPASGSGRSS